MHNRPLLTIPRKRPILRLINSINTKTKIFLMPYFKIHRVQKNGLQALINIVPNIWHVILKTNKIFNLTTDMFVVEFFLPFQGSHCYEFDSTANKMLAF